jgi:Pyruvate phosphate dikinase, AMP/ATP-binding domain
VRAGSSQWIFFEHLEDVLAALKAAAAACCPRTLGACFPALQLTASMHHFSASLRAARPQDLVARGPGLPECTGVGVSFFCPPPPPAAQGVWASKFNERAFLSMRKVGLDFMDIRMAVLCQRVVQPRYAFVIHTTNPATGNRDEVYAELVLGLGESIVSGMVPGSSMAFVGNKSNLDNPKVHKSGSVMHDRQTEVVECGLCSW